MTPPKAPDPADRDAYTHGHHESVVRTHASRDVANSAAYLVPHLRPGLRVLDVGSGPGSITVDLARHVAPGGSVLGVDASAAIVEQARELAATSGVEGVGFAVGDAYALDHPDGSFDVVHAHQVLQHLARPIEALREWRRVLRPGGLLAVREVDYGGVIWNPSASGLARWLELYDDVHRWNGGEPNAGRHLTNWVRTAGFDDVHASASLWLFASPAEREWWGTAWAERATRSQFATHAVESAHATPGELEEIASAWRAWVADPDGWFLMPHGEIVARA
ncbi:methyltransferase domain-containing protein [Agromyces sp. CFH 90414]|uniref:Methyltransferase domain-containing protein n=1 Tax=Agromyces agglutinans TaxID=2662258 RepID=A0A6I2F2S8_9MICO|nr:methyltransferase domain-containing protein [Agromyces agglutinans]MRG58491.1 methyltransferase domain-containing protein [Agromyces agglutinans]